MSDPSSDPLATHALFDHDRVAAGYAAHRPYLHPKVFEAVRRELRLERPLGRALDVGCGTGLSTRALLALAREVVGVDGATAMLHRAAPAAGVRYVASTAEALPFRPGSFDLVVACGSIDWVDRERFLPAARELLRTGGILVALDFGDRGRSFAAPALESWYRGEFQRRYPPTPTPDPMVTSEEARRHGFEGPVDRPFVEPWPFTASQYADFLMTESGVVAKVEYGAESAEAVRAWLGAETAAVLGPGTPRLEFGGYIQILTRA